MPPPTKSGVTVNILQGYFHSTRIFLTSDGPLAQLPGSHMKASPNDSSSKAKKIVKRGGLEHAECYGAKIRFGTCSDSCPNTLNTDFENLDFFRPIQVTFGRHQHIVASGIFGNMLFIVWRVINFLLVRL